MAFGREGPDIRIKVAFSGYTICPCRIKNTTVVPLAPRYAAAFPNGTLFDYIDPVSGLRARIQCGPLYFCAYVGAPRSLALANLPALAFSCPHAITFADWGNNESQPADWFWWGWDYLPFTDVLSFSAEEGIVRQRVLTNLYDMHGHKTEAQQWTFEEVKGDVLDILSVLGSCVKEAKSRLDNA